MAFRLFEARRQPKIELLESRRVEEALRNGNEHLVTLVDVSHSLSASTELESILQTTSDRLAELSGLSTAAVYLLRADTVIHRATTLPLPEGFTEEFRVAHLDGYPI